MPRSRTQVKLGLKGDDELGRLMADLRAQQNGAISVKARRNIQTASAPVITALRSAVMSVQVESSRGGVAPPVRDRGLRQAVARALTVNVTSTGVRISVNAGQVDPKYGHSLPKYLDADLSRYQRWAHPVFGGSVWVTQTGQPWFFVTISRHARTYEQAVLDAIDETIRELS
jgi:hypothetical protein